MNMNIKNFRKRFNLSREDVASKVGVSHMTIWRWEKGLVKNINKVIKEKLDQVMKEYNVL